MIPSVKINVVAIKYEVTTKTIRNWVKQGLPHIKVGRVLRFDMGEVDNWVKGR